MLGQVEVLDREQPAVAERVERARAPRRSRRRRAGSSTCTCVWPGRALAQLHVVGVRSSSSSGSPPQSATCPVSTSSRRPGTSAQHRAHRLARVHDRARPRLEQRAGRGPQPPRPQRSHMPSAGRRRGRRAPPGCGFGNAVGQPTGSASVAGSVPTIGVDVLEAVGARRAAHAPATSPSARVDDVDDAERRTAHGAYFLCSIAFGIDHADGLEVLAEDLVEVLADARDVEAAVAPHPRDLLGVLEDRVGELGAAEDLAVHVRGVLRREARDERRVERRVLLGRRLVARALEQRGRSCGWRPAGDIAFTVMP